MDKREEENRAKGGGGASSISFCLLSSIYLFPEIDQIREACLTSYVSPFIPHCHFVKTEDFNSYIDESLSDTAIW